MLNHNTQLNLFNLKTREFKDTRNAKATYKLNKFIKNHNIKKIRKARVEPVDIKFDVDKGITYILLSYIIIK